MAWCHDLIGVGHVTVQNMQCTSRQCRTVHGYNYFIEDHKKYNYAKVGDLKDGLSFINDKRCFTVRYLEYH
eukprot:8689328-Karenia_brevis.AAC.1